MVNYIPVIATIIQLLLIKERHATLQQATKTASTTATMQQLQPTPSPFVVQESLVITKASSQVPSLYSESMVDLLQSTSMQQQSVSLTIPVSKIAQDSSPAPPVLKSGRVEASRYQTIQKPPATFFAQPTMEKQTTSVVHSSHPLSILSSMVSYASSEPIQRQVASSNVQTELSQSISGQKTSVIAKSQPVIFLSSSIIGESSSIIVQHSPIIVQSSTSNIGHSSSIIASSTSDLGQSLSIIALPTSHIGKSSSIIAPSISDNAQFSSLPTKIFFSTPTSFVFSTISLSPMTSQPSITQQRLLVNQTLSTRQSTFARQNSTSVVMSKVVTTRVSMENHKQMVNKSKIPTPSMVVRPSSLIVSTTMMMLRIIVEISITLDYDPKFNDSNSVEYKNFANNLQNEIKNVYKRKGQNVDPRVLSLRPGSVIVQLRIIFPNLVDSPLQPLRDEIADNKLGNFTVDSKSLCFRYDGHSGPPPLDVTLKSRGKSSLNVSWRVPDENLQNSALTGYQVCVYTKGTAPECNSTKVLSLTLNNLQPSTKYFVTVSAISKAGCGEKSLEVSKITNGEAINPLTMSYYTLSLDIPRQKDYIREVMVIVENSIRSSARSENLRASDLKPYQRDIEGPYVTAYIKSDVLPLTFVIGDGREYNSKEEKYFNQPLKQNSKYIVFLRFFENQNSYYSTEWSGNVTTMVKPAVECENREEIQINLLIPLVILVACFLLSLGVIIHQLHRNQSNNAQQCHKCEGSKQEQQIKKFNSLSNNKRTKDIKPSPKDQSNVTNDDIYIYELPDPEFTERCQTEPEISIGQESSTYMSLTDNREPENVYQSLQSKKDSMTAVEYENPAFNLSGGMQNALQTSSSETTSAKLLLAANRPCCLMCSSEFPSSNEPIGAEPMLFPMMTFVGQFASRLC